MTSCSGAFYVLPVGADGSGGDSKLIPLPESPAEGRNPSISPDGRWLLYSSTQTGSREVFVESLPEQMGGPAAGVKQQVSIAGGIQPASRADGKEVFYLGADVPRIVPARVGDMVSVGEFEESPDEVCATAASPSRALWTTPFAVTMVFAAFKSPWVMPFSCAASSASAI